MSNLFAKSRAVQDQEIAAAAQWYRESDPEEMESFFDWINEDESGMSILDMDEDQLQCLRTLALIGLFEVVHTTEGES